MKFKILLVKSILSLFILIGNNLYAQIGFGTNFPDVNADLTLGSENKGLLLNNVKLVSETSSSPLILKDMLPGMMVYNTTENSDFKEGIYYWTKDNKWSRMYVKTKPTRDMQFVTFKQTNTQVIITKSTSTTPVPELNFDYKSEKNGLLFLDYVLYALLENGKPKAGNVFCYTIVTDDSNTEVFKGITAISPYVVIENQGSNSSFGLSSFVFPVVKGKNYKIRLTTHETYASPHVVRVGDFRYGGQTAHSSMKVTFMSDPEY